MCLCHQAVELAKELWCFAARKVTVGLAYDSVLAMDNSITDLYYELKIYRKIIFPFTQPETGVVSHIFIQSFIQSFIQIKADRPLTRNTLTPPDYWQTDNSNGLVMVICNYHWLNSASRVLISTCSALLDWFKRESVSNFHCLTLTFDLRSWPTIPG